GLGADLEPGGVARPGCGGVALKVAGDRTFNVPQQTVWEVLNDPGRLANTIPGVESFEVQDERNWHANCNIPLGLGSLKMRIRFEKKEKKEPEDQNPKAKENGGGAIRRTEASGQRATRSTRS